LEMMKLVLLLAFLVTLAFASGTSSEQFEEYIREFNKKYTTEEYATRFANFQESLKRIAAYNTENKEVFGLTKFSDMSTQEFSTKVLMQEKIGKVDTNKVGEFTPVSDMPATFDWRDQNGVSAVKNQGDCGSCWAFSATEAIESTNILKGKTTNSINLSPQQVVDCDHDFVFGCNGGRPSAVYDYIIKVGGQEGINDYPYTAKDGSCKFNATDIELSISTYQSIPKNETALQENLVSLGPLSICLAASRWQDYTSGVMTPTECCLFGICELDHCVQLVGYNTTGNYWTVRNSWGTDWGIDGYIQLEMGHNTCGLLDEVTWPSV